jgi:hypothetical protein
MNLSSSIVYKLNYEDLQRHDPALLQRIREGLAAGKEPLALLQELKPKIHFTQWAEVMGATYYLAEVVLPAEAKAGGQPDEQE